MSSEFRPALSHSDDHLEVKTFVHRTRGIARSGSVRGGSVNGDFANSSKSPANKEFSAVSNAAFSDQDRNLQNTLARHEFLGRVPMRKLTVDASNYNLHSSDAPRLPPPPPKTFWKSIDVKQAVTDCLSPLRSTGVVNLAWLRLINCLSAISMFYTPYRLAFNTAPRDNPAMNQFEAAMDVVFCVNVLLHLTHIIPNALLHYPEQVKDMTYPWCLSLRFEIFKNQVKRRKLILYVIGAIPWDFLLEGVVGRGNIRAEVGLGALRVFRVLHVARAFAKTEKNVRVSYARLRAVKFLYMLCTECHWFTCLFYILAITEEDYEHTWLYAASQVKPDGLPAQKSQRYLLSFYFSMVIMSTVGFGDITPMNSKEFVVVIFYLIVNMFLTAWVVGNMTLLVSQADESIRLFRDKFRNLETYMTLNKLPEEIRATMRAQVMLQFNVAKEHNETLDELPTVLRSRVQRVLYRPVIEDSFFANIASEAFLDALSCVLSMQLLMAETDAVSQFDSSFEMFIIVSGTVDLLIDNPEYLPKEYQNDRDDDEDGSECDSTRRSEYQAVLENMPQPVSFDEHAKPNKTDKHSIGSNESDVGEIVAPKRFSATNFMRMVDITAGPDNNDKKSKTTPRRLLVKTLHPGDVFGEITFFFSLQQPFTARTRSICRLLALRRESWDMLSSVYPQDARLVLLEVARRLNDDARPFLHFATTASPSTPISNQSGSNDLADVNLRPAVVSGDDSPLPRSNALKIALTDAYGDMTSAVKAVLANREQDQVAELCLAAASSNLYTMRHITYRGFDVNTSDYDKRTALHAAASKGSTDAVHFLLEKGADPNCVDGFGSTPLFEAIRNGHEAAGLVIFRAGGRLGLVDSSQEASTLQNSHKNAGTLLCLVACTGNAEYLERLIRFGLPVQSADYDGRTGLHVAAARGHKRVVACLLRHNANPSAFDNFGRTPLLEALRARQQPCARMLYAAGAQLGFLSSMSARSEFIREAKEHDSRSVEPLTARIERPRTEALHAEAKMDHKRDSEAVKAIESSVTSSPATSDKLELSAAVLESFLNSSSPSHGPAQPPPSLNLPRKFTHKDEEDEEVTVMHKDHAPPPAPPLLHIPMRLCTKSRILEGHELCLAVYDEDAEYVRLLLLYGCDVNAANFEGRTAAHVVCNTNNVEMALILIEFNADFHSDRVRDSWGHTPLDDAHRLKHEDLASVILSVSRTRAEQLHKKKSNP